MSFGGFGLSLQQQLGELADGNFVDRGVNVLAFGLPGTGKTHALCAVGHRLVEAGRSVLFAPAYRLVQDPRPIVEVVREAVNKQLT